MPVPMTERMGLLVRGLPAVVAAVCALTLPPPAAGTTSVAPPVPTARQLSVLAVQPHALIAALPGAEPLLQLTGATPVSRASGLWQVDGGAVTWLVPALARAGLLRYAEADSTRTVAGHLELGDPLIPRAWQIQRVGADLTEPPGPGVPITIVDTGIDMANPDFTERPDVTLANTQHVPGFDDVDYHGTIVATSAAAAANGVGTVGIHPYARLRIYDLPTLEDSDIIRILDRVAAGPRSVVNLSIGGPGFSRSLYEAVMRVVDSGSLVVAASGNSFRQGNPAIYPADTPHVVTVAGTNQADDPAPFSSGSRHVDIAAPGTDIPVQHPTDPERFMLADGTSFAAPIVAAAAAWVWTSRPDLDAGQLAELLRRSSRDVGPGGFDTRTGHGVLDLQAALRNPVPAPDPGEPNDDVDLIVGGKVLERAKPPLTTPGKPQATVAARLATIEDPHDVYRLFVPAGGTVTVTVEPDADVDLALWSSRARTVMRSKQLRLGVSAGPGHQTESLSFTNGGARRISVYADVWIPGRTGGKAAAYTLSVTTG